MSYVVRWTEQRYDADNNAFLRGEAAQSEGGSLHEAMEIWTDLGAMGQRLFVVVDGVERAVPSYEEALAKLGFA